MTEGELEVVNGVAAKHLKAMASDSIRAGWNIGFDNAMDFLKMLERDKGTDYAAQLAAFKVVMERGLFK